MLIFPVGKTITTRDVAVALRGAGDYIERHGNVGPVDLEQPTSGISVLIRSENIG